MLRKFDISSKNTEQKFYDKITYTEKVYESIE